MRQRRTTGEWLVNRAIARGHVAEAVDFYLRFALAPLVRLVRVEHCPWRHDFGLRYLREDLPPDVADQIEELVPGLGVLGSCRCAASRGWTSCWPRLAVPVVRRNGVRGQARRLRSGGGPSVARGRPAGRTTTSRPNRKNGSVRRGGHDQQGQDRERGTGTPAERAAERAYR